MFQGSDRFEVVGKLGEGGMGVVYEALDRDRGMRVALKALRRVDPVSLIRFKREFRAASELSHPNIVNLYELVADGDDLFFTMELIPGASFIEFVRDGRVAEPRQQAPAPPPPAPVQHASDDETDTTIDVDVGIDPPAHSAPPKQAAKPTVHSRVDLNRLRAATRQLAEALHALHGAGLVHRDLKPSNIRVTPDERVVLMDFGIVADSRRTPRGVQTAVGTPPYMAPEQALGDPPTAAADWYGLGSLLYLALTGRLPFRGTRREILVAKQQREPPPPSELVRGVPDDLNQLCQQLLRRRAHRRPSGQDILRILGAERSPESATADLSMSAVFVGRTLELDALRSGYAAACTGRTISFVVEGESGMGKSTLVRHFLDELEASTGAGNRPFILTARCHERESLSYKGFDGIIDDLAAVLSSLPEKLIARLLPNDVGVLARQFPVLRRVRGVRPPRRATTVNPHTLRARALAALSTLFAKLSRVRPVLLHIDDLQWAGSDSLELLSNLLRDRHSQRLMFVASVRSENIVADSALREMVDELAARGDCRQLAVGPLTNDEQRELVRRMRGSAPGTPPSDAFWSQFGDSPLFLVELLRYLDEAELRAESFAELGLDDVLRRRVQHLEPAPRAMLEAMAVADEALPLSIVSRAARLSPHDGERAAAALRVGHLARVTASDREPWLICNHNRLRQVIVRDLRLPKRRATHRHIAEALEIWNQATPENLARHWLAADEVEEATTYLRQGAEVAREKLAFDHAADLLQAALELESAHRRPADSVRAQYLGELGDAMYLAGRCYEAARTYEAGAELAEGDAALDLQRRAADNLLRSGHLVEGVEKLSNVLKSVGARVARTRRGATFSFLWRRATLAIRGLGYTKRSESELSARELGRLDTMYAAASALGMIDHLRGAAIQARHLRTALQLGEERRVLRALAIELAYIQAVGGDKADRGRDLGQTLLARARDLDDPFLIGVVLLAVGGGQFFAGHAPDAIASLSEGEAALTDIPAAATWERVTVRYFLALAQASVGDYDGVNATADRSLDAAVRTNDLYARTFFLNIPKTWSLLRDDKPEEADRGLDTSLEGWPEQPFYIGHYLQSFSRALVHLYRGDGGAARRELDDVRPHLRELMLHRMPWVMSELSALEARAAIQTGDLQRATCWARRLARSAIDYNAHIADTIFAAIAHRSGDADGARKRLMSARAGFASLGAYHLLAACDYRLAPAGGELGAEARAWLEGQAVVNPERLFGLLLPL